MAHAQDEDEESWDVTQDAVISNSDEDDEPVSSDRQDRHDSNVEALRGCRSVGHSEYRPIEKC